MRKLIVCMDGTGNEIGDGETNVLKLYSALRQDETQLTHYVMGVGTNDSPNLVVRPFQKLMGVLGLAFGYGLEDDVLHAYRWLCRTYMSAADHEAAWKAAHPRKKDVPEFEGDRIYFIGFSRGSYACRVLAGFINNFGLVGENDLHLITPAFRAYRSLTHRDEDAPNSVRYKTLRQYEAVLRPRHVPIRALCLFDTVASIIRLDWPWITVPKYWSLADLGLHANVRENPSVRIVVHALAIDEHRTFYRNLNWEEDKPFFGNRFRRDSTKRKQIVDQRWFAGHHADVGGGVREDEAGISKITALWLLDRLVQSEEAADAEDLEHLNAKRAEDGLDPLEKKPGLPPGLPMRRGNKQVYFLGEDYGKLNTENPGGLRYSKPDPYAPIHSGIFRNGWRPSLAWGWLILEILPPKAVLRRAKGAVAWFRRLWPYYLPLLEPRHIPDSHEIDDSVFLRRREPRCDYDPPNLTRVAPAGVNPWWEEESQ